MISNTRSTAAKLRSLCLFLIAASAFAQTPAPLAFEVASVKPAGDSPYGVRGGCHGTDSKFSPNEMTAAIPLGRCRITDARLSHLLSIAFRLRSMEYLKGGPDWVMGGDDRYNIEAKADDPSKATEAQLLEMLQTLLIERFRLKFHIDSVDKPGFALVVAKNGPKVKESKSEESSMNMPGGKPRPGEPVSFVGRKISMANLVNLLTQVGSGPVIDKTGLEGFYDFKLTWDESAGPTLFTALQEQLGLRCEPQKVPVSVFVIESAQKPAGN